MTKVTSGKKLYEQVVERINTMIAQGIYQKGDLLPSEKELMEMMGVSRITVRGALRLLGETGVIQTVKGKGSYLLMDWQQLAESQAVQGGYPQTFLDSTNLRILLEPEAAREVALRADEEERRAIGDYLSASGDELEGFHRAIIAATHNQVLIDMFDRLLELENAPPMVKLVPPFRQKSVAAKLQSQHEKIYEAIRDGNGEFAYFYMKEHLGFLKDTYEEFFQVFYH